MFDWPSGTDTTYTYLVLSSYGRDALWASYYL